MKVKNALVQNFMKRLQEAEQEHNASIVADVFTEQAKMENLCARGASSADPESFWKSYLSAFEQISSHFTHVTESDSRAVLEWESVGTLATGLPIHYAGVSILEYTDQELTGFRTVYDSASLIAHVPATVEVKTEAKITRGANSQ